MIKLRETMMILDLHRQALSVSAIARQTGIDRKTVRKYIERGLEAPAYPQVSDLIMTSNRGRSQHLSSFTLHTVAQRYMAASTASLFVSGESVFGALGAVTLLGERPEPHTLAGAALILMSIIAVTITPTIIARRSKNSFEGAANVKVRQETYVSI